MGTECDVVVVGGGSDDTTFAHARVEELEARWSRFRPDSELCRLNRAAGRAVEVSHETAAVVAAAVTAWHATGGRFDPTVIDALECAGYDRPFATGLDGASPVRDAPECVPGCASITFDAAAGTVTVPLGTRLDLGGIAKGFAADLVAGELVARGASGALVSLGGDLRALGTPPTPAGWIVGIDAVPGASVVVQDGGLATSATTRRRWMRAGALQHHVIDPTTCAPAAFPAAIVTVFAPAAARAEVLATVALLAGHEALAVLVAHGASGVVVGADGVARTTPDLDGLPT
jgi:thiamine biosynthesis lipoprotein